MPLRSDAPEAWNRIKLTLRWIVYEDRMGNFIVVDPHRPRPLGTPGAMKRPPTVYLATTEQELEGALEELLFQYEQQTHLTPRHLSLVERVREALDRRNGRRKERQAA